MARPPPFVRDRGCPFRPAAGEGTVARGAATSWKTTSNPSLRSPSCATATWRSSTCAASWTRPAARRSTASSARRTAPRRALLLDLSDCGFLDSTGLHAIIDARTAIHEAGGRLAVCCPPSGPVARVIEVALPGMLELYPTRDAALRALR